MRKNATGACISDSPPRICFLPLLHSHTTVVAKQQLEGVEGEGYVAVIVNSLHGGHSKDKRCCARRHACMAHADEEHITAKQQW